ncbi:MAG: ABC transporter permease, partial [Synergistaceae bacterium]|nr:ABC transporter permease [Synergistaceae bacterium]
AVVLSLLGGAIGIASGVGISKSITEFIKWPTLISPESILIAVGFSAAVGVFFGFWPAYKASRLDPIDALRTE